MNPFQESLAEDSAEVEAIEVDVSNMAAAGRPVTQIDDRGAIPLAEQFDNPI